MHPPQLLKEVLGLKLKLTLCDPHQAAEIQSQIDEKQLLIHTITKKPLQWVKDVCADRYVVFVQEEFKKGNLKYKGE